MQSYPYQWSVSLTPPCLWGSGKRRTPFSFDPFWQHRGSLMLHLQQLWVFLAFFLQGTLHYASCPMSFCLCLGTTHQSVAVRCYDGGWWVVLWFFLVFFFFLSHVKAVAQIRLVDRRRERGRLGYCWFGGHVAVVRSGFGEVMLCLLFISLSKRLMGHCLRYGEYRWGRVFFLLSLSV